MKILFNRNRRFSKVLCDLIRKVEVVYVGQQIARRNHVIDGAFVDEIEIFVRNDREKRCGSAEEVFHACSRSFHAAVEFLYRRIE